MADYQIVLTRHDYIGIPAAESAVVEGGTGLRIASPQGAPQQGGINPSVAEQR